jgi:diguanylate cyclase (GGDEF)-like protein/PAS domain S-box-containing protein
VVDRRSPAAAVPDPGAPLPLTGAPSLPGAELYRLLVEHLPQSALYLYDQDLRYLLAEGEAIRAAGLQNLVGRRLCDVASGESLATLEHHYRAALDGVDGDFEHPGEDLDRWYRVRVRPVRDAAGLVVAGLVVTDDVTDARRDREEVASSHAFQTAVLATSPDVVSIFDLDLQRTLWASRSLDEMLGHDLARLQDHEAAGGIASVLHPEDVESFAADMARAARAADGDLVEGKARVAHADGSWRVLARRSTPFLRAADGRVTQVLNVSWDVTDREAAAAELAGVHSLHDAVIAATPDLIMLVDLTAGHPIWSSRTLEHHLGMTMEQMSALGVQPFRQLAHPDDLASFARASDNAQRAPDGAVVQVRYRTRRPDGSWLWLGLRATPFARNARGRVSQLLLIIRDVTDVVQAELELEQAALHDPLTSLPNRRLFAERLRTALAELPSDGRLAVVFLDLDGFKAINDAYGHAAGDGVLQQTAARISASVRHLDTVARVGGDEFLVLLTDDHEPLELLADHVARRLRLEVGRPIAHNGHVHLVTASIGLAFAGAYDDADEVLHNADAAMYEAKAGGKDRVVVHRESVR